MMIASAADADAFYSGYPGNNAGIMRLEGGAI